MDKICLLGDKLVHRWKDYASDVSGASIDIAERTGTSRRFEELIGGNKLENIKAPKRLRKQEKWYDSTY